MAQTELQPTASLFVPGASLNALAAEVGPAARSEPAQSDTANARRINMNGTRIILSAYHFAGGSLGGISDPSRSFKSLQGTGI
jgi:hypothetical protein